MMHRQFFKWAAIAIVIVALAACNGPLGRLDEGLITLKVADTMMARSILPDVGLEADHYAIHGEGTSGQALGSVFDLDIPAAEGSAQIGLLPGGWDLTATVWNQDDPSVAVGGTATSIVVVVGVPMTVDLVCVPYTGPGTLDVQIGWIPDIIAAPAVEVDMVDFASTLTAVPMVLDTSVAAHGSASLEQGWYTGYLRILDNGELNAGVVRAIRIASGANTLWDEFLTVNQLSGQITLDIGYNPGLPLELAVSPAEGAVPLYEGQLKTFTVTGVDNDPGTSAIYAWYLNGNPIALSASNSVALDAANYTEGMSLYLSAVVWQSDGKRAGDAQWAVQRSAFDLTKIMGSFTAVASSYEVKLFDADWATVGTPLTIVSTGGTETFEFSGLPAGNMRLVVYKLPKVGGTSAAEGWQEKAPNLAELFAYPLTAPVVFDFGTLDFLMN